MRTHRYDDELTKGESLRTNIALVKNNARLGARVAIGYAARVRGRHGGGRTRGLPQDWGGGVVCTPDGQDQHITALSGKDYTLHPVQASGSDPVVKRASYDPATGTFTVPARTVAVYVRK